MQRVEALRVVGEIAADQWGLFTTQQAEAAGVNRTTLTRLASAGLVDHVARGVHLVVAAGTPSHVEEKSAWLRLASSRLAWERDPADEDNGVLSHRTACVLHGLGDIPAPQVEITVPRRRTTRVTGIRLHRGDLSRDEITTTDDGLPVTTVERTIKDLLIARVDGGHLGGVLNDVLRRRLMDEDDLVALLGEHASAYGIGTNDGIHLLQHLLHQAGADVTFHVRSALAEHAETRRAVAAAAEAIAAQLAGLDLAQLEKLRAAVNAVINEPGTRMESDQ
ncbi:type IV toxin-antitoxin system AbiEi family antitoxin domain-containing protein [Nocardia sp. NRRL S-836]|uniref:type IV toxin-antitoxin system AbiEi family antitoxin domain-containing protein n=1 Tax=Nocardia sp. NRRL S-836 TaxID=1519492 RepID=UPI0006B0593D|nr:type IV toxin-antitoxin system AbiEi family antitoxin domain-containing protein [Nocardia sp. NRRL S-836]